MSNVRDITGQINVLLTKAMLIEDKTFNDLGIAIREKNIVNARIADLTIQLNTYTKLFNDTRIRLYKESYDIKVLNKQIENLEKTLEETNMALKAEEEDHQVTMHQLRSVKKQLHDERDGNDDIDENTHEETNMALKVEEEDHQVTMNQLTAVKKQLHEERDKITKSTIMEITQNERIAHLKDENDDALKELANVKVQLQKEKDMNMEMKKQFTSIKHLLNN